MVRVVLVSCASLMWACGGASAGVPATSTDPAAASSEATGVSGHVEGGFVVYRYDGTYTEAPVTLEEEVTGVEGNRLTIEVTATRGEETRRWVQIVTDTEENRRDNVVDELYEIVDGERRALAADDPATLMRLYGWTVADCGGFGDATAREARALRIGDASYACECVRRPATCEGAPAVMETCECPELAWGHAYGEARLEGAGAQEPLWRMVTLETGTRSTGGAHATDSTRGEGCDCRAACLCQGVEPSPEQIEEARRAAERCDAAGTPCECPICDAM